ncbi:hypothetical protein KIN20_028881, partial [Parelaphostrongylus tenuis]
VPEPSVSFDFENNEDEERAIAEAIAREEELMRQEEAEKGWRPEPGARDRKSCCLLHKLYLRIVAYPLDNAIMDFLSQLLADRMTRSPMIMPECFHLIISK